MKHISKHIAAAIAAIFMAGGTVSALAITIETVTVGNPGNVADTNGYGAVGYTYNIGKFEVTNAQYAAFQNIVVSSPAAAAFYSLPLGWGRAYDGPVYLSGATSDSQDKPVTGISLYDALRFANWLNNGQGNGSTETGSYTMGGVTNTGTSVLVPRNAGASWVVANENEWHKAAYYDPTKNSGAGGYWQYATQSDTIASRSQSAANGANIGFNLTAQTVGTYVNAASFYGTFDQTGNAAEWMEETPNANLRGGSWSSAQGDQRTRWFTAGSGGTFEAVGFRVALITPIPEPSAYGAAMGVMALGVVMMRRRKVRSTR